VPSTVPSTVRVTCGMRVHQLARPKSGSFADPPSVTMMLAGLEIAVEDPLPCAPSSAARQFCVAGAAPRLRARGRGSDGLMYSSTDSRGQRPYTHRCGDG